MLSDVVLDRPSKARRKLLPGFRVFGILRVLRGAENVPDRSFEAQQKQLVARRPRDVPWQSSERPSKAATCQKQLVARRPRDVPWQSSERPSKAATCQIAVSKPNRNSLWRLGGPMAKQPKAVESCWEGFEGFEAFKGC